MSMTNSYFYSNSLKFLIFFITFLLTAAGITLSCQTSDHEDIKLVRIDNMQRVDVFAGDKLITSHREFSESYK